MIHTASRNHHADSKESIGINYAPDHKDLSSLNVADSLCMLEEDDDEDDDDEDDDDDIADGDKSSDRKKKSEKAKWTNQEVSNTFVYICLSYQVIYSAI